MPPAVTVRIVGGAGVDHEFIYRCRFERHASLMFSDSRIPSVAEHCTWIEAEIGEGRSTHLIGEVLQRPVGFVRFASGPASKAWTAALEHISNLWFASLAVDVDQRGRGIGSAMFRVAEERSVREVRARPLSLMTWARRDNPASWAVFESAGWTTHSVPGVRDVIGRTIIV